MTDEEKYQRKLKANREYKARKKAGLDYVPRNHSAEYLKRRKGKNAGQPTKKADFCPEAYARKLETNRLSRERRKKADPEAYKAKNRKIAKEYYAKLTEEQRYIKNKQKRDSRNRKFVAKGTYRPKPFAASVAAAAAPSHWRDMLLEVGRLVGYPYEREDIIAEAMLLTVEGFTIPEAVAQAKRKVTYDTNKAQRALSMDADDWFEPVDMSTLAAYV